MSLLKMPLGTMFLFPSPYGGQDTYVTTSEPYPCHFHGCMKVKALNIDKNTYHEFGQGGMLDAEPLWR